MRNAKRKALVMAAMSVAGLVRVELRGQPDLAKRSRRKRLECGQLEHRRRGLDRGAGR